MLALWWDRKDRLAVTLHKGERGRWRWEARNELGAVMAVSPVQGHDTEQEALEAAEFVGNAKWKIKED